MSQPNASKPICRRILLKLSGEALMGEDRFGIDPEVLLRLAREVAGLAAVGIQVGLVLGGGNIFRGAKRAQAGLGRVTGDHMGMLATLMNALAMQDALEGLGTPVRVMSSLPLYPMCEDFSRRRAIRHLEKGRVTIFAGGTGNPLFTTDSAASLRAIEIDAELLIKATKVNGIYSADPVRVPEARFYSRLTYDQAIRDNLQVMDTTALVLCRDHRMPLRVMNIYQPGALLRLLYGQDIGSLVASGD